MELTLRVTLQFAPQEGARVGDVLQRFRRAEWVRFVMSAVLPQIKRLAPTDAQTLRDLLTQPVRLQDGTCVVCMGSLRDGNGGVALPCGHAFHADCVRTWLERRNTCPSCRLQLPRAIAGKYAVLAMSSTLVLTDPEPADDPLLAKIPTQPLNARVCITMAPQFDAVVSRCRVQAQLLYAGAPDVSRTRSLKRRRSFEDPRG